MSTTVEEFRELLTDEVHLDMDKLRSAARHGIPDEVSFIIFLMIINIFLYFSFHYFSFLVSNGMGKDMMKILRTSFHNH